MQYTTLGKTGLKISRLGFGGIPIQKIDAAGTRALFLQMKEAGINFVDTARGYTVSESYIGEVLEGIREHFVLATKSMSRDKEGMAKDIETSLSNLRTDYIDLYQIHNPNMAQLETAIGEGGALEALLSAKAAGKIGHIGITAHSLEVFEKALTLDFVETIMFPYNIVETQGEELMKKCTEKNIGFIAMKPLAGGALDDATLAMRFILNNPDVTVVIPGMAEAKEIEQNAVATDMLSPLTEAEDAKIAEIRKTLGTEFCRRCNYCAPCTVGINISAVFLFDGYLTRYGLGDWAKERYNAMGKKASDCIGCGVCEARCPYNLPIREMLKRAAKRFDK
ncbi:MAG: aldo/keto reductase [Clostridia bacterium]|nr:aldo/keto reductase [Clostridia bacterium]